jgi:ABC-type transport system substrate-binding protein
MKKALLVLIAFLTAMMMVLPSWAFVDVENETWDTRFEMFGPHIDKIFIKMYNGVPAVYQALINGEIDVLDWPATKAEYNQIVGDPDIATIAYGSEAGYYEITFNQNNRTTLGPPGPLDPNPKYPNYATANVWFRRACAYLINRTYLEHDVAQGFGIIMYTEICPYMVGWLHTDIPNHEEWAHPYNPAKAAQILDEHGFPVDPSTGMRFPDVNGNGVRDPGEVWDDNDALDFYCRLDTLRKLSGEHLVMGLQSLGVPVEIHYVTGGQAYVQCMINKDFHFYTGGWIFMGPEPDYLYDLHYSGEYYHDPEAAPANYQCINDSVLDEYLYGIKYGYQIHGPDFNYPTYPTPITKYINSSCWAAQERMCYMVHDYPLMATYGVKGVYKTYTDQGKPYTGHYWRGVANQMGLGINSWFTFFNAYPEGFMYGNPGEEMIMQYGWKETGYPQHMNILYAEWYWDFEVLGKIYDAMGARNPYALAEIIPWMINYYELGTYPFGAEIRSKVLVSLKTGIKWFDGNPVTAKDVVFSLVECTKLLMDKGYSPPWWHTSTMHILSYTLIDPLTVEFLMDSRTAWALLWVLIAPPIIPEHIWRPIITSGDPTLFMPDTTMTGSGPFKFVTWTPGVSLVMEANKDYFRYLPIMIEFNTTHAGYQTTTYPRSRVDPGYPKTVTNVVLNIGFNNLWLGGDLPCDIEIYVDDVLNETIPDQTVPAGSSLTFTRTYTLAKCNHNIKARAIIKGDNPWAGKVAESILPIWVTIKYDIAGGSYLGKVVAPDCKVDGKDNAYVAAAYGTIPGDARWKANADVNGDYKIDGKDVAWIAKYYGKW